MAAEDFRKLNVSFVCENCGFSVPPAKKTSRNHCPKCLCSKHVDIVPGDRKEVCQGIMDTIDYDYRSNEIILVQKCRKCGKLQNNKAASDDEVEQLLQTR